MLARALLMAGFDTAKPESMSSFPSLLVRTAIFPLEPMRTLMLFRRGFTVILAMAASFRMTVTVLPYCAKRLRGASVAAAQDMAVLRQNDGER
jgi:hypothetical protein